MPIIKSEFACPLCEQTTGQHCQIVANAGELVCSNNGTHRWNDYNAFTSLNPKMVFKVEMPKNIPQEGHGPLTVTLPMGLISHLQTRYGDKLSATVGSVLREMCDGTGLMVTKTDVDRITAQLGEEPKNSSHLYGMIFSMMLDVAAAKQEKDEAVRDMKAYEGLSVGRVLIDLGANYQAAAMKAKDAEMPLRLWLEQQFKNFIDNNWI